MFAFWKKKHQSSTESKVASQWKWTCKDLKLWSGTQEKGKPYTIQLNTIYSLQSQGN